MSVYFDNGVVNITLINQQTIGKHEVLTYFMKITMVENMHLKDKLMDGLQHFCNISDQLSSNQLYMQVLDVKDMDVVPYKWIMEVVSALTASRDKFMKHLVATVILSHKSGFYSFAKRMINELYDPVKPLHLLLDDDSMDTDHEIAAFLSLHTSEKSLNSQFAI